MGKSNGPLDADNGRRCTPVTIARTAGIWKRGVLVLQVGQLRSNIEST